MNGSPHLAWQLLAVLLCTASPFGAILWAIVHDWNRSRGRGRDEASQQDAGR
jgi:hypothetical protein